MLKNVLFLFFVTIIIVYGCNKTELLIPKENSSIQQILEKQNSNNRKLLEGFLEGTLPITSSSYRTETSYDVSKEGEMLYFPTEDDLKNYILAADYLVENWEYENSDTDDASEEINQLGNPALNVLDEIFSFNSLRYKYLTKEYEEGIDFIEELEFYVDDPDIQIVLNNKAEIRVGNEIIKFLRNNKIGIIDNLDEEALNILRERSVLASHNNLRFYDEQNKKYYLPTPPPSPPSGPTKTCAVLTSHDITKDDLDYRTINIELLALGTVTENGNVLDNCHYLYEVTDWGDGFSTNFGAGDNKDHTYNVNLTPGQSQTFTIKVKATRIAQTGDCTTCSSTKTWNVIVAIANPLPGCNDDNFSRAENIQFFTYDNDNYAIKRCNGQRTTTNFWNWNEKLWAKTIFYKQKSNGKYRRRKPPIDLITEIQGVFFTNDCTTESQPFTETKIRRRKSVTVRKYINNPFGTIDIAGDPKQVTSNHTAQMDDNPDDFVSFNDFSIFP